MDRHTNALSAQLPELCIGSRFVDNEIADCPIATIVLADPAVDGFPRRRFVVKDGSVYEASHHDDEGRKGNTQGHEDAEARVRTLRVG